MRFIVLDVETNSEPRNRALPLILDIPEEIRRPDQESAKEILVKAIVQNVKEIPERTWRWNKKFVLSESDAERSPEIRSMFQFVDWNLAKRIWFNRPECHLEAYDYVKLVGPAPSVEELLASDTLTSYRYAMDILGDRFPLGEKAIGRDPLRSINYSRTAKCRVLSAEDEIAKDEELAEAYGKLMKENRLWCSWAEEEISRSPVWMYQYAKDYVCGSLPSSLHNRMHLLAFSDSDNKWIKKYLSAKKYMSAKITGNS